MAITLRSGLSLLLITVITVFTVLMYIVYVSIVGLNLVFTHATLPASSIPYYDSTGGAGHPLLTQLDRYTFEWWLFATDTLRIIPAFYAIWQVLFMLRLETTSTVVYTFIMGFSAFVELLKMSYRAWQYGHCSFYQLCRNFDPNGDPSAPNYIWLIMFWFGVGFMLLYVVYSLLGYEMKKAVASESAIQSTRGMVAKRYYPRTSQRFEQLQQQYRDEYEGRRLQQPQQPQYQPQYQQVHPPPHISHGLDHRTDRLGIVIPMHDTGSLFRQERD